jgi:hypothetical protein
MARTVAVELLAKVGAYKRGMGEAKQSTKDVDKAITDVGSNQGLAQAAEKTRRFGRATSEAKTRARADFAEMVRNASELDRQIATTQKNLTTLAKAFASDNGNKEVGKELRAQQRQLAQLMNVRKLLPSPAEFTRIGSAGGTAMAGGMSTAMRLALHPATIAIGAAVAPLLGAAVAGGIIGGAGIGGVIGGVMIASKDQRVQLAATNLKNTIGRQLQDAALPFVGGTMDALAIFEQGFNGVSGNIRNLLRNASLYLKPLASGVVDFMQPVIRGIDGLVAKAAPVIEAIRRGLGELGRAVEGMFASLQDNGVEAGMAISVVFNMITKAVQIAGAVINGLTEAFGFLVRMADKLGFLSDEGKEKLAGLRGATDQMTAAGKNGSAGLGGFKAVLDDTGGAAATAAVKVRDLDQEISDLVDRNLSAREASLALRDAMNSAAKAVDKKRIVSIGEERALIGMARAANTATRTLDEQGRTVKQATSAHEANRKKLIETAIRMGYTRAQAKRLADQYLATPKNVNTKILQPGMPGARKQIKEYDKQIDAVARSIRTNVSVKGDAAAYRKLRNLLVQQEALEKGISVSAASSAYRKQEARAFHSGGWTGPGGKYDPAGTVHADEFVVKKESRRRIESRHPGLLREMNATGQLPGYAAGGRVLNAPFPVNVTGTKIMSLQEALSKVTPSFGNWPSSPGAQRGDSGVWRRIVALIRSTGPMSGSFGNGYRPGDPKWHGSGRAVDWMGYNQDRLARYLAARRPLELIHRTNGRDYAYTRGRNMGSFNSSLMEAHRNHIHIAMANGGVIREPVFGVGASGATYSFGERGAETVTPGVGGGTTVVVNNYGAISVPQFETLVVKAVDKARGRGRKI